MRSWQIRLPSRISACVIVVRSQVTTKASFEVLPRNIPAAHKVRRYPRMLWTTLSHKGGVLMGSHSTHWSWVSHQVSISSLMILTLIPDAGCPPEEISSIATPLPIWSPHWLKPLRPIPIPKPMQPSCRESADHQDS